MGNKYFVEYGALQRRTPTGPCRVIECTTSALDARKISEIFAKEIAEALNTRGALFQIAQTVATLGPGVTISRELAAAARGAIQ